MNPKHSHSALILLFFWLAGLIFLGVFLSFRNVARAKAQPTGGAASITVEAAASGQNINACVLGTNLPAWLGASRFENPTVQARTRAAGVTLIRMPGGSWSNWYPWLDCEQDNSAVCEDWIADPTDFINFLRATGLPGMWTVNQNRTSKEAAALVAFMNGQVGDDTVIGVDVNGVDWGTVGDWAQLRANNGNPDPIGIRYWEVGNEIYGGTQDSGKDCLWYGWEDVWTCDGVEYVNGIGSGSNRKEGFLEFRDAMRAVDPTIMVGAVGIPGDQSEWTNWGNEVIAAAGDEMDFYIVHQYAYFNPPGSLQEALAQPQQVWAGITQGIQDSFDQNAGGRQVPVAVTEYNLFSVQDMDNNRLMTQAVNMLFMADTIGQMMVNGVDIATQWDLMNGQAGNGTDYGLMHADTYSRYPQYYVFPLWAGFGSEMLPVNTGLDAESTLSVYAGRIDANTLSVLAINKTGNPVEVDITFDGVRAVSAAYADVAQANSLTATSVTFNGVSDPLDDLSNAPSIPLSNPGNPLSYSFAPYSVTLLRVTVSTGTAPNGEVQLTPFVFLPVLQNGGTTEQPVCAPTSP